MRSLSFMRLGKIMVQLATALSTSETVFLFLQFMRTILYEKMHGFLSLQSSRPEFHNFTVQAPQASCLCRP